VCVLVEKCVWKRLWVQCKCACKFVCVELAQGITKHDGVLEGQDCMCSCTYVCVCAYVCAREAYSVHRTQCGARQCVFLCMQLRVRVCVCVRVCV